MSKRLYTVTFTVEQDTATRSEGLKLTQEQFKMLGSIQVAPVVNKRTKHQNDALHLWMTMLEEECNARGITMDMLITKPQEIPVTRHILKDLFRFVGKKMFGIKSTTELDKIQFGEVQKTFEKTLGQNCDLYIPFPSINID